MKPLNLLIVLLLFASNTAWGLAIVDGDFTGATIGTAGRSSPTLNYIDTNDLWDEWFGQNVMSVVNDEVNRDFNAYTTGVWRGTGQWIIDNQSTTGTQTFSFDYATPTTGTNQYSFRWDIIGSNSLGGTNYDVNLTDITIGSALTTIGGGTINVGPSTDSNFSTPVDFGSGYEYVIVRIMATQDTSTNEGPATWDNVSVIPEPSTLALVGLMGLAGLAALRRRR